MSGPQASASGRVADWTLPDRDVAIIDASSLAVSYARGLMNIVMAIGVRPGDGQVTVVGTDAVNEIRFEPNLKGRFVRVELARFAPELPAAAQIIDLNAGHLDYSDSQIAAQSDPATASQALRDRSIGDPRAIAWRGDGTRGYVAGMGSNNVVVIGPAGERLAPLDDSSSAAIGVGPGPTGLVLDSASARLYVLERFGAAVSWIDLATEQVVGRRYFHDATPEPVRAGRRFLYDTRSTSGLGHVSCASCHVDARMDRLAWDLGDPSGDVVALDPAVHNLAMGGFIIHPPLHFGPFHPMKGPMVSQTLVDIIGKEPLHWRGDRAGIEAFNGAFESLLGDDVMLSPTEMQQLKGFLATLTFPPSPASQPRQLAAYLVAAARPCGEREIRPGRGNAAPARQCDARARVLPAAAPDAVRVRLLDLPHVAHRNECAGDAVGQRVRALAGGPERRESVRSRLCRRSN